VTNLDGTNDLRTATAARWVIYIQSERDADWEEELKSYEIDLEDFIETYSDENPYIDIYYFGATAYDRELDSSFDNDLQLI
jgi:hypothetical protein